MSEELENKEFDRIVQQKFAEHGTTPPDHLFAQIDSEAALLQTESLKSRVIWYRWIIVALLFLFTSTLFFYYWPSESNQNDLTENKIQSERSNGAINDKNETTNQHTEKKTPLSISDDKKTHIEKASRERVKQDKPVNGRANSTNTETKKKPSKEKVSTNNEIEYAVSNNPTVMQQPNNIEPDTKEVEQFKNNNNEVVSSKNNSTTELAVKLTELDTEAQVDKTDNDADSPIENIVTEEVMTSTKEPTKEKDITSLTENPLDELKTSADKKQEEEEKPIENDLMSLEKSKSEEMPTKVDDVINLEPEITNEAAKVDSSTSDTLLTEKQPEEMAESDAKKSLSKFSAALFFVPNFTNIGLSSSNNNDLYTDANKSKAGVSVAVGVGYHFKPKWTINMGITHHSFKSENSIENQRPKDLPLLLDPQNSTITVYSAFGTAVITNIGNFQYHGDDQDDIDLDDEDDFASLNYAESQEITMLDIPITISYELGNGKLRGVIQAGLLTSIVLKDKTEVSISNIYQSGVFATTSDFEAGKKISIGTSISLGAKYSISNRFSILFLPGLNNGLLNLSNGQDLTVKPRSIDLKTGLQYNF